MAKAQVIFPQAFKDLGMKPPELVGGWSWFKRNLVLLMPMTISKDPAENKKMRENYRSLIKIAAANGWGEYRTATAFMDHVMDQLSFNNHALRRYHETIKDAVDPNGILAPGKSGIWPKRYRESHT
jgi:4-cresol dehydrogenase (hydroxylating)